MIVSKDINPEKDVYYLGSKVIEIIYNTKNVEFDFFDIFEKLNSKTKTSINLFILTLDWLYLVGAIKKSKNGEIVKCF